MIDHEAQKRYNAKMKYKGKLEELDKCIEVLAEEANKLITYGEFIELLKLQLEVQKELYRLESEKT